MGSFLDFAALKEEISFSAAIELLHLNLKPAGNQWRGPCPACNAGGDRALVVTEGRGFYCFSFKKGGDQIALAAHVLDLPARDAAQELATRAGIVQNTSTSTSTSTNSTRTSQRTSSPESEAAKETQKLQPLSYLESDHDAVHALGLAPEWCKLHGVGYAPRGVVRGSVAIPFRDEDGVLLGYFGVQELTYLPAEFQTNVVKLHKRA